MAPSARLRRDPSLSLPGKLPHPNAKALVKAILDALAASVITPDGSKLMRLLIAIPLPLLDEAMQTTIAAVMTNVETEMKSRLAGSGGSSSSSSSSSSSLPMPNQPAQPAQPAPVQLDVSVSLSTNARRLVQGRLGRALTQVETEALDEGLVQAFSLLTTGNQAQRRATLQLVALTTLSTAAGAHYGPVASKYWPHYPQMEAAASQSTASSPRSPTQCRPSRAPSWLPVRSEYET